MEQLLARHGVDTGVRLRQEYEDHLATGAASYSERNLVIVPHTTRHHMAAAVQELARSGFGTLVPEADSDR
jgi:hypothetical protein